MPNYAIHDLQEADLANVADLWFRAWHAAFPDLLHPMPYDAWLPRLRDEIATNCVCRVATVGGASIGFVAVNLEETSLEQVFVAPEHQGLGAGKLLVDEAKRLSSSGLKLTTLQRNARAAAFYSRQGFTAGDVGTNPVNGLPNIEYVWHP